MLLNKIRMKIDNVPSIAVCCFIVHNVAKRLNDEDFDFVLEERQEDEVRIARENESHCAARNVRERGQQKEQKLLDNIVGMIFTACILFM